MKTLILLLAFLPMTANAGICNVSNSDHMIPLSWVAPTHRERGSDGVEKALPLSEIKGYEIIWSDNDDGTTDTETCRLMININTATSYNVKGQAGTEHKFQIVTIDTGGRTSVYSPAIYKTTDGTKPAPPPSNQPASKITNMKVESR